MQQKDLIKALLILENPQYLEAIDISRTKTNKTVMACEEELSKEFNKLFNLIIKNSMTRLSAEQQFGKEIRGKINACIQKAYFAGQSYVAKATKKPVVLTVDDVIFMEDLTDKIYNAFFDKVDKINWRYEFLSNPLLIAQVNSLPQTVMINVVQIATTNAIQALYSDGSINSNKVIFKNDPSSNVCNFCYPLDDRIFEANDPNKPEIPVHPNCHCRYLVYSETDKSPIVG